MSRAHDLFVRLETEGLTALERLLEDIEPESLFLDFKRAQTDGSSRKLGDSDSKNLSKGISGFSNSEGGLLIWGVDCRRDPTTGHEIPTKHPVDNAAGFRTLLESAVSRETIPPHSGVRMLSIVEGDGNAGYVAVLIPKSESGPFRSTKTQHYHIRAGSAFEIVSHDTLAGMFGRSPAPNVAPNFLSHPTRIDGPDNNLVFAFGIVAANFGAVLAEKIFLSVWYGNLDPNCIVVQARQPAHYPLRRGTLPGFSIVASDSVALAPGAADDLCDIVITLPRTYRKDVRLELTFGARGAAPARFAIDVSAQDIAAVIEQLTRGDRPSTDALLRFDPPLPEPPGNRS